MGCQGGGPSKELTSRRGRQDQEDEQPDRRQAPLDAAHGLILPLDPTGSGQPPQPIIGLFIAVNGDYRPKRRRREANSGAANPIFSGFSPDECFEVSFHAGPLFDRDAEHHRGSAVTIGQDHLIAEHPFADRADPFDGPLPALVAQVGLQLDSDGAQVLEGMSEEQ